MKFATTMVTLGIVSIFAPSAVAQPNKSWSTPIPPFEIVEGVYYVGTEGLASYLIVSGNEAILLDSGLEDSVIPIEENIRSLGYALENVHTIINSHAHFDHAGGIARLKADTGAAFAAMAEDVSALESGKHDSDQNYSGQFAPVKVDRPLRDGDVVSVGTTKLRATLTPGHTKGCTTWSMDARQGGKTVRVVFPCSLTVAGSTLVGNRKYPGIADDFRNSFERLGSMKADIVLPAHPEMVDLFGRKARRDAGNAEAFVDRGLLGKLVARSRTAFEKAMRAAKKG